jgi:hypothetical protein
MNGFEMNVEYRMKDGDFKWVPFIKLEKTYSCTCCCINRPVIKVIQDNEDIGYIISEWSCCSFMFNIYENMSTVPIYTMKTGCCECGMMCSFPCGLCEVVDIAILNNTGSSIGKLRKIWGGCDKPGYSDPNYYEINFPKEILVRHKILILACSLFLYQRYFEEKIQATNKE